MGQANASTSHPKEDLWSRWNRFLFEEIDNSSLIWFRLWFGFLMACEAWFYHFPRAETHYASDAFHFTYPGFWFIRPWEGALMSFAIMIQTVAALGVMFGVAYRLCAAVLFLTYTHLFLIDEVNYNNHYYLFCLLLFFMIFVRADGDFSIGSFVNPEKRSTRCPRWNVFILRTHLFIAYFYGGITKINGDWLRGEPMHKFLLNNADTPTLMKLAESDAVIYFFAYGGMLFDLFVPILLLFQRTRIWVIPLIVGFNLTNHFFFTIGTFPWFMLGSTVLFFAPDGPRRLVKYLFSKQPAGDEQAHATKPTAATRSDSPKIGLLQKSIAFGLALYLVVQLTLPFRHHFHRGYTDWTKLGQKFCWRMKSNSMDGVVRYFLVEKDGTKQILNPVHLNRKQANYIGDEPRLIATYAKVLRKSLEEEGLRDFEIRCDAVASLNGRPYQYLIDPNVDISRVETSMFGSKDWIVPLKPNQPIGNYAMTAEERTARISAVISGDQSNQPAPQQAISQVVNDGRAKQSSQNTSNQ